MKNLTTAVVLMLALAAPAAAQQVSGLSSTSFNLSFSGSSVDQIGNDSPDLVFRDVTFGVELPITQHLGVWVSVSKSADLNRSAADGARKLTGAYSGGLSYLLAQRGNVSLKAIGGLSSRLERVGDGMLNPTAARFGASVGVRLLGEPTDTRWFGLFVAGGLDLSLRDIMSETEGDIMSGNTTYAWNAGFEFSL